MRGVFSSSNLLVGIIEEIDIYKVKQSPKFSFMNPDRFDSKEIERFNKRERITASHYCKNGG